MKQVWVIVSASGLQGIGTYPSKWDAEMAANARNALAPAQGWRARPLLI